MYNIIVTAVAVILLFVLMYILGLLGMYYKENERLYSLTKMVVKANEQLIKVIYKRDDEIDDLRRRYDEDDSK